MAIGLEGLINRGIKTTDFWKEEIETYKDERIKIYSLGNKPSLRESKNPGLHFLAVPRDYTLTEWRPSEEIIKFSISPDAFSADLFDEGTAEEVKTKKAYILLTDFNNGEKQQILPFQTHDSFRYKIFLKNMKSRLKEMCEDYMILEVGECCEDCKVLAEIGAIELRKRKEEFAKSTASLYKDLREKFAEEIDSTEPLDIRVVKKEHRRIARNAIKNINPLKQKMQYISNLYIKSTFASFDDQIIPNKEITEMMNNPATKEVLGVFYDSARRLVIKEGNTKNIGAGWMRFFANVVLASVATSATRSFASDDIANYVWSSIMGYASVDLATSMMNTLLSTSRKDLVASSPGLIGTIRELCKRKNYYNCYRSREDEREEN